eukprot:3377708-Pyramimonas_sp.AAC.1
MAGDTPMGPLGHRGGTPARDRVAAVGPPPPEGTLSVTPRPLGRLPRPPRPPLRDAAGPPPAPPQRRGAALLVRL